MTVTSTANLATVFSALRTNLRRYLRKRVNNSAVVDDLLQDVFVKALNAINDNRSPKNIAGWLYAAARTTVADYYRSTPAMMVMEDANIADEQQLDDELLLQTLANCLKPLVHQLPAIYRDTLIATDFEGKTMQSVADEWRLSLSAIKSRASRGRVILKEKLLTCCDVNFSNGRLGDYQLRSPSRCTENCT